MEHSFDVDIAVKYGFPVAILLKHFYFWCEKNKDNDRHLHDGLYWTYQSVSTLMEIFPYLTRYQIGQALKDMVKEDLIIEGKFPNKTNRSKWYALTENGKSICRNQSMHLLKSVNPFTEIEQSIDRNRQMDLSKSTNAYTDIDTYIDTDSKTTDIDTDRESARPKKPKPKKHRYGEFNNVLLSDEEFEKLGTLGVDVPDYIERLSGYMESKKKSYASHYATLRNWIRKDKQNESLRRKQNAASSNPFLELLMEEAEKEGG